MNCPELVRYRLPSTKDVGKFISVTGIAAVLAYKYVTVLKAWLHLHDIENILENLPMLLCQLSLFCYNSIYTLINSPAQQVWRGVWVDIFKQKA